MPTGELVSLRSNILKDLMNEVWNQNLDCLILDTDS